MEVLVTPGFFQHITRAEVGGRLYSSQISVLIGTRPEAIKLAPVARALAAVDLPPTIILSGQHPALDLADHGLPGLAVTRLGCAGREDPHVHVREVAAATLLELRRNRPELLIVQGDTSSALGGAVGALWAGVPIAHVEAGLRTGDPAMPWPEEEYRTWIDAHAELLFAPTAVSAENLRREGVPGTIYVTGNSGIDALVAVRAGLPAAARVQSALPRVLVTCHRRENWGEGLKSISAAVARLAKAGLADFDVMLHPNAHVAQSLGEALAACFHVRLLAPCSHSELVGRMRDVDLILSDSGGVQEEAPALGIPLLVLRDKTERPEGVASGNMRLIGTGEEAIVAAVTALLADPLARQTMSSPAFPFGDGSASVRIAAAIAGWMEARGSEDLRRA